MTKFCKKCGEIKDVAEFSKHARHSDGLQSNCKACLNIVNEAYRAANREKAKADCAKWRAANPERARTLVAKWVAANPDRVKAVNSAWAAANPAKVKAYAAKWREANAEAIRTYNHNRRVRKREAGGRLSKGLAANLFRLQRGKCACGCKQPLGKDYHLDHIMPIALGGENEDLNIQLLRQRCNNQKSAKHPVDYMQSKGFLI